VFYYRLFKLPQSLIPSNTSIIIWYYKKKITVFFTSLNIEWEKNIHYVNVNPIGTYFTLLEYKMYKIIVDKCNN